MLSEEVAEIITPFHVITSATLHQGSLGMEENSAGKGDSNLEARKLLGWVGKSLELDKT